jgi:type III secretion protein Q
VPIPFELPVLSRGFAALTPAAAAVGARAADAAAAAVGALLGRSVSLRARPSPGAAHARAAASRVTLDLTALPATAVLEVEPTLVVALVDALAGGEGIATGATALTPIEAAALELVALAAVDGACSVPEVERVLAPRVARGAAAPDSPLAVELEVASGAIGGRGRLLVPAAALRALRGPAPGDAAAAVRLPASIRSGRCPLLPGELAALAPGDVVLLDAPGDPPDALVLPGGARITGRLEEPGFHVHEVTVMERSSELPVVLEVELARVVVPLAELARLEPGAAIPLGIDRRGVVTLRIGERPVARGELVDVDGAIGVRVLSLHGEP